MDASPILASAFLSLGIVALWALRRGAKLPNLAIKFARPKPSFPLEVVGRLHLSNQHSIQVVRAGSRVLVVGLAGSAMTVLDSHEWEDSAVKLTGVQAERRAA